MSDRQQTIETGGQKPQPHIDSAWCAMRQVFGMKHACQQAKRRFNQKALVPRPTLTDFDRNAIMLTGPEAESLIGQANDLALLPFNHIPKFLVTDVGRQPLPF